MDSNPSVVLTDEVQWLHPVQIGPSAILTLACRPETLGAVDSLLGGLVLDPEVERRRRYWAAGRERFGAEWVHADRYTAVYAAACLLRPRRCLEVGIFRGRGLAVVGGAAADCELYGFDPTASSHPGPTDEETSRVRSDLARVGHRAGVHLASGPLEGVLPAFLRADPDLCFDLVAVSGVGATAARSLLEGLLPRVAVGGGLVCGDIGDPANASLRRAWRDVVEAHRSFSVATCAEVGPGVAIAVRCEPDEAVPVEPDGGVTQGAPALQRVLEDLRRSRDQQTQAFELERRGHQRRLSQEAARLAQAMAERGQLRNQLAKREADLAQALAARGEALVALERQGAELGQVAGEREQLRHLLAEREAYLAHILATRAEAIAALERQGAELVQVAGEREQLRNLLAEREAYLAHVLSTRAEAIAALERQGAGQELARGGPEQRGAWPAAQAGLRALDAVLRQTWAGMLTPARVQRARALVAELTTALGDLAH